MTLVRLAEATGLSTRILSKYENGHAKPGDETLSSIAAALDVSIDFLGEPDVDDIPVDAVSFRALTKITAVQRDAAISVARIGKLINGWIETIFELPEARIPSLSNLDPESAADVVRARWGLGEAPISNVLHVLESNGVRVFSIPEPCAEVDAFSFYSNTTPFVFLNTSKTGERGRFDAAHELGHLVLHGEHRIPHGPDSEREANRFAAAFLMPRAGIFAQNLRNADMHAILRAKKPWRVAAMAMTHRLHELELTTEWGYRAACVELSRLGYRRSEPGGIARESSQLLGKVFRSLRDEGAGPVELARALKLSLDEITGYVFGLVPTVIEGGSRSTRLARPKLSVIRS